MNINEALSKTLITTRAVKCNELNISTDSIQEMKVRLDAIGYKADSAHIGKVCSGKHKTHCKLTFTYI